MESGTRRETKKPMAGFDTLSSSCRAVLSGWPRQDVMRAERTSRIGIETLLTKELEDILRVVFRDGDGRGDCGVEFDDEAVFALFEDADVTSVDHVGSVASDDTFFAHIVLDGLESASDHGRAAFLAVAVVDCEVVVGTFDVEEVVDVDGEFEFALGVEEIDHLLVVGGIGVVVTLPVVVDNLQSSVFITPREV